MHVCPAAAKIPAISPFVVASRLASGKTMLADFSAELEGHVREVRSGQLGHDAADRLGPGEADLVDSGMAHEPLAHVARATDRVVDAGREPGAVKQLPEAQDRHRRVFRRLRDRGAPHGQRRSELPGQQQQG